MVDELPRQFDQAGDVLGGGEALGRVDLARLGREQHLPGLHADVDVLDAPEPEVGAWSVQHDGAAGVDHVRLEEQLVDLPVVVDDLELVGGEVQTPVHEVRVYYVDGVVFVLAVQTSDFEDFA